MTFIQLISFRTHRYDEFGPLEAQWEAATQGSRTLLGERALRDRDDRCHYVHLNEFDSYESAMANSALPETDALAAALTALCDGPIEFGNFEVIGESDERSAVAARLKESLAAGTAPSDLYTEETMFEGQFPNQVVRLTGPSAIAALLRDEAPSRTVERWDVTPTSSGFVAEYTYRTSGAISYYSCGVAIATLSAGRISRLLVTCGGSSDAATEQQILGTVSA